MEIFKSTISETLQFSFRKSKYKVSQDIEDRGFFVGLPTQSISNHTLNFLVENLLNIENC